MSCLIAVCLVGALVGGVSGYLLWASDVAAKYAALTYDFSVDGDSGVDYGLIVDSAAKEVSYTVTNTGNTEVEVSPVLISVEGAVASWDRNVSVIPVAGNTTFILSLDINGSGGVGVSFVGVYCDSVWRGSIDWNYEAIRETFTVDGELAIAFGNVTEPVVNEYVYVVTNTGNVPISVAANAEVSGNMTSVSWDKIKAAIAVGGSAKFNMTLIIAGEGTCAVSFDLTD